MLSPATRQRPPSVKTVSIVEDDPDLRRIFANALFWAGFRVEQAGDGPTALQMIENDPPDVLVLDLMLPTLDGLRFAMNSERMLRLVTSRSLS